MKVGEGVGKWGCECCEGVQGFIQQGGGYLEYPPPKTIPSPLEFLLNVHRFESD